MLSLLYGPYIATLNKDYTVESSTQDHKPRTKHNNPRPKTRTTHQDLNQNQSHKSNIRLLRKSFKEKTIYKLIIAVIDASMIYR